MNNFKNIPLERRVMFEKYDFEKSKEVLFEQEFLRLLEGCEIKHSSDNKNSRYYVKNNVVFFEFEEFKTTHNVLWINSINKILSDFVSLEMLEFKILNIVKKHININVEFYMTSHDRSIWEPIEYLDLKLIDN